MPIRNFDVFAAERRLLQPSGVAQLKDTRLGIEGNHWLRKILSKDPASKEPAVSAMGGSPLKLRSSIERELKAFKANHIQPIFVFPGLSIVRKDKPFSNEDNRPSHRATAWELYDKGQIESANGSWGTGGSVFSPELLGQVFHILHEHKVEFLRAPYSAWAQLAYMYTHPKQIVNALYGGSELLMFDIDKVITSIDFEKGNYLWISKKTVLQDLHVSDEQFLDMSILAGIEYCPSFPPLNGKVGSFSFKDIQDLMKQHKTGFNIVQSSLDNPIVAKSNYLDIFCRASCAIRYHPIITEDGEVKPLNAEHAPSDIHEFIGYRLPDELYYYLMRCLIGSQSLNTLVSGVLIENAPLDNGESMEYREFLLRLLNIRTQTMSLLTQPLNQFYHSRKVSSFFWFDPTLEHVMQHHPKYNSNNPSGENDASPLNMVFENTRSWHVTKAFLADEKKAQDASTIDIAFCMKATATVPNAAKTISRSTSETVLLEQKDEIVANVLWKTLEIRDFLTSTKHIYTPWGHALAVALATASDMGATKKTPLHVQEAILTALELIRFEVLTENPFSKTYSPIAGNTNEQKHIRLISRALSLLPMDLKSTQWSGPVNRDLLAFNSFAKALSRSYRNLTEMLVLSLFLNRLVVKERTDYFDIADSLPYIGDNNVALGLVVKHYLEKIVEGCDTASALSSTVTTFPTCVAVKSDMEKGFRFWDALVKGIQAGKEAGSISNAVHTMFVSADNWLQTKKF